MYDYKNIFRYKFVENESQRFIASILKMSRNKVSDIIRTAESLSLNYEKVKDLSNEEIENILFPNQSNDFTTYLVPNYKVIHQALLDPNVTLNLLWEEYTQSAKSMGKPFYHRSYFFKKYKDYVCENKLTMHIEHKPGEKMMVDWNGKKLQVNNKITGEVSDAYIFVATLPFSNKTYVRATPSMKQDEWIRCHIEAYNYFGGVTRLLIPDNLKTGVISHPKNDDIVLNKTYEEMAEYYGTIIIPTRVRKPKDKAAVEGSVGLITNYLFGRFRNRTFFSFDELNKAILEKLEDFNNADFQKRSGSRNSIFQEEELSYLRPLPLKPFELCEYKTCKVNLDYHISVLRMNYSVPYGYVGKYVDVKISDSNITIFYKGTQIATHIRLKGRRNQYSTLDEHMPEEHKMFKWNGERFRKWALSIGDNTYKVIDTLLTSAKAEEQAYRGCISILKLSDKYTKTRLEKACKLALEHLSRPGYKNIKTILECGQDESVKETKTIDENKYAYIRGAEYYGKNK